MVHLPVKRFFPFSWLRECLWAQEGEQEAGAGGGGSCLALGPGVPPLGGQLDVGDRSSLQERGVQWVGDVLRGLGPVPAPLMSFLSGAPGSGHPKKLVRGRWLGSVQSRRVPGLGAG